MTNGKVGAAVDAKTMDTLIGAATTIASEDGTAVETVVIAPEVKVELATASVSDMAKKIEFDLAIETDMGSVSISNDVLASIAA